MTMSNNFPLTTGTPIDREALVEHWNQRLSAPAVESKVTSVAAAIGECARPRDTVYLGGSLGASGMVTILPPLRVMVRFPCG
jgi:hypothetical protein